MSIIINDAPVDEKNPLPLKFMTKDLNTGQYIEADSNTPLQVVLSQAVPVGGTTLISIDDGAGNPITISRSAVDPGAMKVEVINSNSSNIIELDDGAGNPVTISHLLGKLNVINHLQDGAGNSVQIKNIGGVQETLPRIEDPATGLPTTIKNVKGKQRVAASSYYTEIAMGNVPAHNNFYVEGSSLIVPVVKTFASNLAIPALPKIAIPSSIALTSTSAIDVGGAGGFSVVANVAAGAVIINIDGGSGNILAGDTLTFANDVNIYTVLSYVPNIAPITGGVLTITTPLILPIILGQAITFVQALPAAGAHKVDVYGADAAGNFLEEGVYLNGLLPVVTKNLFSVVNQIIVVEEGPLHTGAAGIITAAAGVQQLQQIDITNTQSHSAYFYMPLDKKGLVTQLAVAADNRGLEVDLQTTVDQFSLSLKTAFMDKKTIIGDRGSVAYDFSFPPYLAPGSEVRVVWADINNKGIIGHVAMEILMEDK